MRVLAAFDKFKDSISASRACEVAAAAVAAGGRDWPVELCPLSDGGEGFAQILTEAAGGRTAGAEVAGPRGQAVRAAFGLVSWDSIPTGARRRLGAAGVAGGPVAVIEMAAASGLALLRADERDPLRASTAGTGQLIRAAAAAGARAILLGVGGSATNDLGLGALSALGLEFSTDSGMLLQPPLPADWPGLRRIGGRLDPDLPPILIACDVDNPLLGPRGAAATYGPQKGLRAADFAGLEAESARLAALLCRHFGRPESLAGEPGAGAAGGTAFGLLAAGARLLAGSELVAAWLDLDARLAAVDVVLTGEGCFDETSLSGKGPGTVIRRALALGKPVHVFAGRVTLGRAIPGLSTHAITPPDLPLADALAATAALLSQAVQSFASGP